MHLPWMAQGSWILAEAVVVRVVDRTELPNLRLLQLDRSVDAGAINFAFAFAALKGHGKPAAVFECCGAAAAAESGDGQVGGGFCAWL